MQDFCGSLPPPQTENQLLMVSFIEAGPEERDLKGAVSLFETAL